MKKKRTTRIFTFGTLALLVIWMLSACNPKPEKSWKYFGEDTPATATKTKQAGVYP